MSDDDLRQEAEALHHGAWQCNTNREAEELIFAALRRVRDSERQRCAAVCRTVKARWGWHAVAPVAAEACAAAIERGEG